MGCAVDTCNRMFFVHRGLQRSALDHQRNAQTAVDGELHSEEGLKLIRRSATRGSWPRYERSILLVLLETRTQEKGQIYSALSAALAPSRHSRWGRRGRFESKRVNEGP